MIADFSTLQAIAMIAPMYRDLRLAHPTVPARRVLAYCKDDQGLTFEQFNCPGHTWSYTGAAYGGDDESYGGEGRCYCSRCGADGDA